MITSITFQFKYNKNYLNEPRRTPHVYGTSYVAELETELGEDLKIFEKTRKLVAELRKEPKQSDVQATIRKHFGVKASVSEKSKTKRTYSIHGLTIHEDDKT